MVRARSSALPGPWVIQNVGVTRIALDEVEGAGVQRLEAPWTVHHGLELAHPGDERS